MATQIPFSLINTSTSNAPSFKNKVINGNFDFWQRATSATITGTNLANDYPSADKWKIQIFNGTTGTGTVSAVGSQQAFTLGQTVVPNEPTFFFRAQASALGTASGTGARIICSTYLEGVRTLAGQTATLSFWAKADTTRTYALGLAQSFGSGGSPSATAYSNVQTFTVTSTFQFFSIQLAIPSLSGKTIGTIPTADYIGLTFILYKQDNTIFGDSLGVIGTYSTTPFLDLAQVQLEPGPIATPFELRPIEMELKMCQRTFERVGGNAQFDILLQSYTTIGGAAAQMVPYKVTKRVVPAITKFGTWAIGNVTAQPSIIGTSNTFGVNLNAAATATGSVSFNTVDTTTYLTANADY